MKIWIDGYEANVPQRLGSSQVAFNILKYLEKIDHTNDYVVVLPTPPLADLPHERQGWKYKVLKSRIPWTIISLPVALFLEKTKPDLVFSPTHYIPRFVPSGVKRVVTIFDLAYLYFPQMFVQKDLVKLRNWTKFSIKNADHIITISNSTKNDILKNYSVDKNKITVAYPGYDKEIFHPVNDLGKTAQVLKKYGIEGDYLIYTGTIQPRKNLIRLIEAFSDVLKNKTLTDLKLLIVGKTTGLGRQGWMFEDILKRPAELGIGDKVIFTGFAPTEDLPYLFSQAIAFVLVSLWEGFGITALEALASGIPVIASDVSSLPEVVGKAGFMVDPTSLEQIAQAIRLVTTDKKLRIQKSKQALIQVQKFSWEKMAKQILKVFADLEKK